MSIRPRDRFLTFRRDNFTCQYCGRTPPEAVLECDHVVARANGGRDDLDNLITACRTCNIGKGVQDAFNQYTADDVNEKLRRVPKKLRGLWMFTGRCDGCKKQTDNVEFWDNWQRFCEDCADERYAKGLMP